MEQFFSSENIAFVSFALLIIGFLKFILYYKAFGIPIIDYIDSGEIVTLFADNIATASVVTVVLAMPYVRLSNLASLIRNIGFLDRLESYWDFLLPMALLSIVFLVIMIAILWKRPKIYNFELVNYVVLWVVLVLILPVALFELKRVSAVNTSSHFTVVACLVINFALLVMLATSNEVKKVKKFGFYSRVAVKLSSIELLSTTDEYFVGKTKSFVFFYSSVTKAATAYSSADLVSITYS